MASKYVYVVKFEITAVYTSAEKLAEALKTHYGNRNIDVTVYGEEASFSIGHMSVKNLAKLLKEHVNNYLDIRLDHGDVLAINRVPLNGQYC